MYRRGHFSSLPNETILNIVSLRKEDAESLNGYWRRLATSAGINKKLYNILQPTQYRLVAIELGRSARADECPADIHTRHLRRCKDVLRETKAIEINGAISHSAHEMSVYQAITTDHIARIASYVPNCTHIQILHTEILVPNEDQQSDRRERYSRENPHLKEVADEEEEDESGHKSIGVGTMESIRERRERERKEEDATEPEEGPPPKDIASVKSIRIDEAYNTTPNAIITTLSLFPNVEDVVLDDIHWSINSAPAVPDVTEHRIKSLSCLDITFDITSDIYWPDTGKSPTLPILTRYEGLTKHLQSLRLGYSDSEWMNDSDILAWTEIPLDRYVNLKSLSLCTMVTVIAMDYSTPYFFQAAATLLSKAPPSLTKLDITIIAEEQGGMCGLDDINQGHWEGIRDAMPHQINDVTITFAVDDAAELPDNLPHLLMIHDAFAETDDDHSPCITLTTREDWHRENDVRVLFDEEE